MWAHQKPGSPAPGILRGGGGGTRCIGGEFAGVEGATSGSSKPTLLAGRRESTRGFRSMSPGADTENDSPNTGDEP